MTTRYNLGYVWTISLVAAMGGLLFGYDWVVIGGAKPFFEKSFGLTSAFEIGWANSCALVGCLVGSMITGALSDRFGRKKLLIAAALLFAGSSVLTGWAGSFPAFVTWRIAGGVAIGMASSLSPMYIAEVAPAHLRGRLVAVNQLTIVIGILAAQIVNWIIAARLPFLDAIDVEAERAAWNVAYGWRWMFTAVTVPSVLFFAGALFVPESPRWLHASGARARARRVLARIGGEAYAAAESAEIERTLVQRNGGSSEWKALLEPRVRAIVLIGVTLAVLQQWSGINSIFNYAEEIFRSAGYGIGDIMFNIVITGTINLVFTLVAIGLIDRIGRRTLMLAGCAAIGVSHLLLGGAYAAGLKGLPVLVLTLCSLGAYALSLAPVTWVLIAEIFPNRVRGAAVSVAVSALWVACFILTFAFPLLQRTAGIAATFWIYAAICFAGFFFVRARVPETKGRSLEQIESDLGL
ncbi:MAG: sugar porter family MFS transporter [Vicinamibacterales bacterium]|nr:sugar porter family MFS transporter [Vicinamibacterales bacterium]